MKVRCRGCNKRFDYELHSGLCPKCGEYYRLEEERSADWEDDFNVQMTQEDYEEKYESHDEYELEDYDDESYGQEEERPVQAVYKVYKSIGRHGRGYYIVTAVLVLIIILVAIVPLVFLKRENNDGYQSMTVEEFVEPKQCQVGEAFFYEGIQDTYQISITGASVDNDSALAVPEGYEMVVVSYHISADNEDGAAEDTKDGMQSSYYDIYMKPYLITKSGSYLKPMSEYDVRDAKGLDYNQMDEMGLSEDFCFEDGVIYYLVKTDDTAGMWIGSYDFDESEYSTTALRENIKVNDLEVKR